MNILFIIFFFLGGGGFVPIRKIWKLNEEDVKKFKTHKREKNSKTQLRKSFNKQKEH